MPKKNTHINIAKLLSTAREKKGFRSVREIYRKLNPSVDYQTWSAAEAGRRVPYPDNLLEIAEILNIDKKEMMIAYSKDKFVDKECQQILNDIHSYSQQPFSCNNHNKNTELSEIPSKNLEDINYLLKGMDHAEHEGFTLTVKQVKAMQEDIRLRLFLLYTYDEELKTTIGRLCEFFSCERSEALEIATKLETLGLITIHQDNIQRVHKHTSLPQISEAFTLRKQMVIRTLEQNIKPDSHITNFHFFATEQTLQKIRHMLYFARAKFIGIGKIKEPGEKSHFQIAIVANQIKGVGQNNGKI